MLEDAGPLAALVSAIERARTRNPGAASRWCSRWTSLIPWQLLEWLIQRAQLTGAWATVPIVEGRPQPLCAVYSAHLAPHLRNSLWRRTQADARDRSACPPGNLDKFLLADVLPPPRRAHYPSGL